MDGAGLMFLQRHFKHTIGSAQSWSETARRQHGTIPPIKRTAIGIGCRPLTCQFIEATPSKMEFRKLGADAFKCGEKTIPGRVYCEAHCQRCYVPLTEPAKP